MSPLELTRISDGVYQVRNAQGLHVGNLKRIGAQWKFKAVGYTAGGAVIPGGGPLTDRHGTAFAEPDAALVSAGLLNPM